VGIRGGVEENGEICRGRGRSVGGVGLIFHRGRGAVWILFFWITAEKRDNQEKNRVKWIDFFTLPPAAASYVCRILHCDTRIRNLNFYHHRLAPMRWAAETNTAEESKCAAVWVATCGRTGVS
jgi:hypothetical protein